MSESYCIVLNEGSIIAEDNKEFAEDSGSIDGKSNDKDNDSDCSEEGTGREVNRYLLLKIISVCLLTDKWGFLMEKDGQHCKPWRDLRGAEDELDPRGRWEFILHLSMKAGVGEDKKLYALFVFFTASSSKDEVVLVVGGDEEKSHYLFPII
ncbi:hypothetical protein AV530_016971 [Patagioenas fasciata monilis]|uniref:Uncharacterized protein n=1 Tax=Patagioenas fasciata monilis TaxID=372326 RepID=A0A1V4J4H2_PATFA|nr:hypothetical protein AV530_016971 [Patagioenas fasciata monilis]